MEYTFSDDLISDLHKDAWGYRPSKQFFAAWAGYSDWDKQAVWDDLCEIAEQSAAEQRREEAEAVRAFEQQIASLRHCGARTWAMALEWLHQAYGSGGDDELLEFRMALPFGHIRVARCAANELSEI